MSITIGLMIGISRPLLACIFLAAQLGRVEAAQCITKDEPKELSELADTEGEGYDVRRWSDAEFRAVVITKALHPNILDAEAFSLAKTLENIIMMAPPSGAPQPTAAEREALLNTLLEGLRADELSNKDAGITFRLKPREVSST